MKFEKKDLFTIPNILTYIRLLAIPFFIWMMIAAYYIPTEGKYLIIAFLIFIFAEITDILDGKIARKYNMISDIGKVLDPVADKVLQCFAIILLAVVKDVWFVWIFMGILVAKEVFMGISSKYFMRASKRQIEQKSKKIGKAGATVNFIGLIITYALNVTNFLNLFTVPNVIVKIIYYFDMVLLLAACVLQLWSVTDYTIMYTKQLHELQRSGILDTLDRYGNPIAKDEK